MKKRYYYIEAMDKDTGGSALLEEVQGHAHEPTGKSPFRNKEQSAKGIRQLRRKHLSTRIRQMHLQGALLLGRFGNVERGTKATIRQR